VLTLFCQEILSSALSESSLVIQVVRLALDYCDVYMPLFHRSTLNLECTQPLLILSLCCLGIFLSGWSSAPETGRMLQKHVWLRSAEVYLINFLSKIDH
jgi:hypothetical protein